MSDELGGLKVVVNKGIKDTRKKKGAAPFFERLERESWPRDECVRNGPVRFCASDSHKPCGRRAGLSTVRSPKEETNRARLDRSTMYKVNTSIREAEVSVKVAAAWKPEGRPFYCGGSRPTGAITVAPIAARTTPAASRSTATGRTASTTGPWTSGCEPSKGIFTPGGCRW